MVSLQILFVLACGIACSAIATWWAGLSLRRAVAAPMLAERVHRHRQRTSLIVLVASIAVSFGLILVVPSDFAAGPAAFPMLLVCLWLNAFGAAAGDYPVRRAIFGERWGFAEYFGQCVRTSTALWGFWLALLLVPYLVHRAGDSGWWVAAVACGALWLWSRRFADVLAAMMRSAPVDDDGLIARFDEILQRSHGPRPDVSCCGSPEGSWANAFALPSLRRARVLFTRPLLDALTADETAAIFAHEVAHLEDFTPARLRVFRAIETMLILAASLLGPVLGAVAPQATAAYLWGWIFVVVFALFARVRGMQAKETESDQRAVELCGDGDALIGGLVKLHSINKMPRRLAASEERVATHPSLARRIHDIRALMPVPAHPAEPAPERAPAPAVP
ncbi:MAG: M48 family metallopeptidase, partial [Planctomycetota bacterium]|nr:M48 family metallopeptidase [Planctomycetota bacterium]